MKSADVILVPSINGLGHARRLAVLALGFRELGRKVTLLAPDTQLALLAKEFSGPELCRPVATSNHIQFDLEGPSRGVPSDQKISEVPERLRELLSTSSLCISDNVLWPHQFSAKGIVIANFLWSDYWHSRIGAQSTIKTQRRLERDLLAAGTRRFANPLIAFSSEGSTIPRYEAVPLLRYPGDSLIRDLPLSREIWIAGGTTSIESSKLNEIELTLGRNGFPVLRRETWKFRYASALPSLVVGRPGLGSMRDALSAGIPFLPIFSDRNDPEMTKNAEVLHEFVWKPLGISACFDELIRNKSTFSEVFETVASQRETVSSLWESVSDDPNAVVRTLLAQS